MKRYSSILIIFVGVAVIISAVAVTFFIYNDNKSVTRSDGNNTDIDNGRIQGYERCIKGLPAEKLAAEGFTSKEQFFVQFSWNPSELKTGDTAQFEVRMFDKDRVKPLVDVTYDFLYKGARDSKIIQDRHVDDFSLIDSDKFYATINYPCDLAFIIYIDRVGDRSFLPTDLFGIEWNGNVSSVAIRFQMIQNENGNIDMIQGG